MLHIYINVLHKFSVLFKSASQYTRVVPKHMSNWGTVTSSYSPVSLPSTSTKMRWNKVLASMKIWWIGWKRKFYGIMSLLMDCMEVYYLMKFQYRHVGLIFLQIFYVDSFYYKYDVCFMYDIFFPPRRGHWHKELSLFCIPPPTNNILS